MHSTFEIESLMINSDQISFEYYYPSTIESFSAMKHLN